MSEPNTQPKARDFRLQLNDDKTHRQIAVLRFSRSGFLVILISALFVLFAGTFAIIAFTPVKTAIPGYPDAHTRREAVQNAIRIDSLESVISRWEYYSENLVRVLQGEATVSVDSILQGADAVGTEDADRQYLASQDSLLRDIVNEAGQFVVNSGQERSLPIEGMHFFTPLKGTVTNPYTEIIHPFVDIQAPANSVVMSALDGAVIFTNWSEDLGYTIVIQHESDIVSIYKQNSKLLKKTGDRVSAGSSIAISGGAGEEDGHLHFELWYKGAPVDPTKYMNI